MTSAAPENPAVDALSQDVQRRCDEMVADAQLAAASGKTPAHTAARQRVARQFIELHLPEATAEQADQAVAGMDFLEPVQVVNAAGIDVSRPASRGMLGFGRRPQYLVGQRFKPVRPEDPIYALKSYPAR